MNLNPLHHLGQAVSSFFRNWTVHGIGAGLVDAGIIPASDRDEGIAAFARGEAVPLCLPNLATPEAPALAAPPEDEEPAPEPERARKAPRKKSRRKS